MPPSQNAGNSLELSDTALKLSKVIERRRSNHHESTLLRVQSRLPSFSRSKTDKSQHSQRSRRSLSVAPSPDVGPALSESINSTARAPSPKKSSKETITLQSSTTAHLGPRSLSGDSDEVESGYLLAAWLFFEDPQSSTPAYYFSLSIYGFIIISTFIFVAETEAVFDPYETELSHVETACAAVFSFELVARLLVSPSKMAFLRNYANWVDFLAVFPYYMERLLAVDNVGSFGAIRIVRLTRVARVLKMSRYSSAIQVFTQAISISIKPLSMLIFLMAIAMIIFSSAIYFAEFTYDGCRAGGWMGKCDSTSSGEVDTAKVSYSESVAAAVAAVSASDACVCVDPNPYQGIATSFWWCIVTMSTVGYGDMTPVTWMGKAVGCCTVLTGMLVLALPITVIGTNFQKVMKSVMHETMRSNVDYLKGKRMLCRNEIEAILERFHAVTEGIHLDIDDVISVYDTDNSGMLEDEELAKFRNDLEVLQNRACMNQLVVSGVELPQNRRRGSLTRPRSGSINIAPTSTELLLQNKAIHIDSVGHRRPVAGGPILAPLAAQNAKSEPGLLPENGSSTNSTTLGRFSSFPDDPHHKPSGTSSILQVGDNELMLRLLEMQERFQDRLLETERRLESKLNNLTKIVIRLEGMMESED